VRIMAGGGTDDEVTGEYARWLNHVRILDGQQGQIRNRTCVHTHNACCGTSICLTFNRLATAKSPVAAISVCTVDSYLRCMQVNWGLSRGTGFTVVSALFELALINVMHSPMGANYMQKKGSFFGAPK